MPRRTTPVEPRTCDNCGARMTSAGRRSKLGRNFCSKDACLLAKQRANYAARRRAKVVTSAPTSCACCGTPLPPRKTRSNDSPYGRWCRAARCQRDKEFAEQRNQRSQVSEEDKIITRFVNAIDDSENRALCSECGLENAVPGFRHPARRDGAVVPCFGVGEAQVPKGPAALLWPGFF